MATPDDIQNRIEDARERIFKLAAFRSGQRDIICDIVSGRDTLAVMPTGSGKSLCYQLPAVVMHGLTLVISPLIALMKDQVDVLLARNIPAAQLHSGLSFAQQQAICEDVAQGRIKLLFVAPERFRNQDFQALLRQVEVGLLAVDEAHCISQWGHDFRPDYRRIGQLRDSLDGPPTIALTATASTQVQRDIVEQLHLSKPSVHILGFDRRNLLFCVRHFRSEASKLAYAIDFVKGTLSQRPFQRSAYEGCGIVYAATIKQAEAACEAFRAHGIRAGLYHARLSPERRSSVQDDFMNDAYHCLVATTAFGMGVDKPNIRYVLHLALSSSLEAYTQESGRAGRDGMPAQCVLLFTKRDARIQDYFIQNAAPGIEVYRAIFEVLGEAPSNQPIRLEELAKTVREVCDDKCTPSLIETALRKLRVMALIDISSENGVLCRTMPSSQELRKLAQESEKQKAVSEDKLRVLMAYAYDDKCRTRFILRYFGSKEYRRFSRCHHCDLCHASFAPGVPGLAEPLPPESLHFLPLKVLSTIARFAQQSIRLTSRQVADVLTGNDRSLQMPCATTYGLLAYLPASEIQVLCAVMRDTGLMVQTPARLLEITPEGRDRMSQAQALRHFPMALQDYLRCRFPDAAAGSSPWMPQR
ncbi:MAG: ATP-dependent DNA helicase [Proteobacteria bacterium]|nr:ATP-dependent DNA helicase [Pseudomonadota bacterium]